MNNSIVKTIYMVMLMVCIGSALYSKEVGNEVLLKEIASGINQYKGRELTLYLKLKNYNKVFERITFYDRKNYDIMFDISSKEAKKRLKKQLLSLHEGMMYKVTFTVKGVGSLGVIIAELKTFSPRILEIIP